MSGSQVPRLKDVAEAAKVSLSAASRILRGQTDRFGDETCRRVEEAARELGWRKNLLVSGIITGRTKTIGVLIPPFDSFWVGVLAGIHKSLSDADYLPVTVWAGDPSVGADLDDQENGEEGMAQISRLLDRRVDGLIVWPKFALAYIEHFSELNERKVPIAIIDYTLSEACPTDSIETDEGPACRAVVKHLLELGHKKIACVSTNEGDLQTWALRRRESFEEGLKQDRSVTYCKVHAAAATEKAIPIVKEMLADERPTAVFAVTDHLAAAVYQAAYELNWKIPADVSVVGFGDLNFSCLQMPPLTTVRQRSKEVGRQAARIVIDRIEGVIDDVTPTCTRVGTDFMDRKSTARPKSLQ